MTNRPEHPYVDFLGLKYDSTNDGRSKCSLKFRKDFLNPRNVIHGGVIYALADSGMGEALLSTLEKNQLVATIEIKITYLKPAGHFDLVCDSLLIRKGRRVAFLESDVYSDNELISKASGSFSIL